MERAIYYNQSTTTQGDLDMIELVKKMISIPYERLLTFHKTLIEEPIREKMTTKEAKQEYNKYRAAIADTASKYDLVTGELYDFLDDTRSKRDK